MKQWENQLNRLIKEAAIRRASERGGMSRVLSQVSNSTNPAQSRSVSTSYRHDKNQPSSSNSVYLTAQTGNGRSHRASPYSSDEHVTTPSAHGPYGSGPQGYPPDDGFCDEDEFEEYPTTSYLSSGRGTPMGSRQSNAMSIPPERDSVLKYDRPRAQTEDTNGQTMAQWRAHGVPPPMPVLSNLNGLPSAPTRPTTPHLPPTASTSSYASEPSFGAGRQQRPPLRSQFSSTKMKSVYDNQDPRNRTPHPPTNDLPPPNRSRSASQPSAYVPKAAPPPPLPTTASWIHKPNHSVSSNKRGSGSSQSTGDSSDYSPNSSSPITPFGSSESSLGGVGIRPARSQNFENAINGGTHLHFSPPVKVKVHFHEDIFVIQVPRTTEYSDLVEKVGRKIRLCGPRRDDGPLRVKYRDEDGDMVSLGSTEDVQMAFEHYRPGGQVTLFVT